MTTRISVESGAEHLLPFAKRKLAQMKENEQLTCRVDGSDGSRIILHNAKMISPDLVDTIRISGGRIETFFNNDWWETTNPDGSSFVDRYAIAETARGGIMSTAPALGKYPLEALRRLLAAKQWGAVWAFCNYYFSGDPDDELSYDYCAYLKFGWQDSDIGTDVLVIDPTKLQPWNFFSSGYPPHYEDVAVESTNPLVAYAVPGETVDPFYVSRFSSNVTVADLTELLSPFFGTIVNNAAAFFPVPDSDTLNIAGMATFSTTPLSAGSGSRASYLVHPNRGPFDHDGAYVIKTIAGTESFQNFTVRGVEHFVRSAASSTVEFVRYNYSRRVTGFTSTGSATLAKTLAGQRSTSSTITFAAVGNMSHSPVSVSQPRFTMSNEFYVEHSGSFIPSGTSSYDWYSTITNPPATTKLGPEDIGFTRAQESGLWVGTTLPFPSDTIAREFKAPNGRRHRNYVNGKYEIYNPSTATVEFSHSRSVDDPTIFGANLGWGSSSWAIGLTISQTITNLGNYMAGGFEWTDFSYTSTESLWSVDLTGIPVIHWPRVFPTVLTPYFQEYKHFLYRPTTGDVLIADYLGGVSDRFDGTEDDLLRSLRNAYYYAPTAANRDAFASRFDILYRRGIDKTLLMNSSWWRGITLVI